MREAIEDYLFDLMLDFLRFIEWLVWPLIVLYLVAIAFVIFVGWTVIASHWSPLWVSFFIGGMVALGASLIWYGYNGLSVAAAKEGQ